jgi:hypothetical protein
MSEVRASDHHDPNLETIGTFEDGGETFEIDHLGIGYDTQWGEFAVYLNGKQFTVFELDEVGLKPEFRPELPPLDELTRLALGAIQDERAEVARRGCPCPENQRYGTCGH